MKRLLLVAFSVLTVVLTSTTISAWAAGAAEASYTPANIAVLVNGTALSVDQGPVLSHKSIMVPLRAVVEPLGATVTWTGTIPQVRIQQGDTVFSLNIGSDRAFKERAGIFFLEEPPVLVKGHTMVSLRFLAEGLGAKVDWDETRKTVFISTGDFMGPEYPPPAVSKQEIPATDNYYRLYDLEVGSNSGPSAEEAKAYVLKQGLLKTVKDVQFTPIRFCEYGDTDTMVVGNDELGREKAVWLTKNRYGGTVSVTGSVVLAEAISREKVYDMLRAKGIKTENIKKMYLAPYEKDKIYWLVIAEQADKTYHSAFDCKTGTMVLENVVPRTP